MAILIGVDEAGYGPNYGPLCVAASAWRVGEAEGVRGQGCGFGGQGSGLGVQSLGAEGERERAGSTLSRGGVEQMVRAKPRAAGGAPDLYKLLRKCVARAPDKAGRKIAIADSKALYSPQTGLRHLERGGCLRRWRL